MRRHSWAPPPAPLYSDRAQARRRVRRSERSRKACWESASARSGLSLLFHQYRGHRFRDVIDVARIERRDADTPAVDRVHRVFLAQAPHLVFREARVREHPALLAHEAEVEIGADRADLVHELAAHRLDA